MGIYRDNLSTIIYYRLSLSIKLYSFDLLITDIAFVIHFVIADKVSRSGPPRGGQKGSLSGDTGGPGVQIVRFRMQNSSAQTADAIIFFFISGRNSNICGRYDLILLITRS